jgi:hypothetical protein
VTDFHRLPSAGLAGGKLLFVEHGLAPDEAVRRWQDRLTPAWRYISGGCYLNRPIRSLIEGAGFRIDRIETGYMPGQRLMTFMYDRGRSKSTNHLLPI